MYGSAFGFNHPDLIVFIMQAAHSGMKKIVVLSDTHIPKAAETLPDKVKEALRGADLILHAGDLISKDFLEELKTYAPLRAVRGNMDEAEVIRLLPKKDIVQLGKFKIGLIHGWGSPFGLEKRISNEFSGVDAIIFGHSHNPYNEVKGGILLFNPGSPTDKVFAHFNTFGILYINDTIKGEIIRV